MEVCVWGGGWTVSVREREMYNYTERTGPQLEDGVACAFGLYHSAGIKLGYLLRRESLNAQSTPQSPSLQRTLWWM